jgi:hypothetical protein
MRIHNALLLSLAATGIAASPLAAYQNPETVPVYLGAPFVSTSTVPGFHPIPTSFDLSKYFKEYTSPGPVLTFKLNAPATNAESKAVPNSFRMQVWFVNPDPKDESDTDDNTSAETGYDQRIAYQNLAVMAPDSVSSLITYAVGGPGGTKPILPGSIFWYAVTGTAAGEEYPSEFAMMLWGHYKLDPITKNLVFNGETWGATTSFASNMSEGVVNLTYYSAISDYTLLINMGDNSSIAGYYTEDPVGKIVKDSTSDDLDVIKMLAGSSNYKVANSWWLSDYFSATPLWNSYTEAEHLAYAKPEVSDYITIDSVSIADPTGTDPSHGLRFIEDQPHDTNEDYDDDDNVNFDDDVDEDGIPNSEDTDYVAENWDPLGPEIDPNASIKHYFDITLSPEGILHIAPKPDMKLSDLAGFTLPYYFRVYVNDGVNDGLTGTPYFRAPFFLVFSDCFTLYMGGSVTGPSSTATYKDSNDVTTTWKWYNSTDTGWYLVQDNFPTNRWVYSTEHGWIYCYGDDFSTSEGIYWYNAPSSYQGGSSDDEVGWLWLNSEDWPYMYSFKDKSWVVYVRDVDSTSSDNAYGENGENDPDSNDVEDDADDGKITCDYVERVFGNRLFYSYRQHAYISASGADVSTKGKPSKPNIKINNKTFGTGLTEDK